MRKFSFSKGVSAALVAMALVTGLSVPVSAAKAGTTLSQQEVTKSGATILSQAPAISLKQTTASGQIATKWTVAYSPVPAPITGQDGDIIRSYRLSIFVFDKGDRTNPLPCGYYDESTDYSSYDYSNPSVSIDDNGKLTLFNGIDEYYVDGAQDPTHLNEVTISGSQLTPGKKEIVAYLFDAAGYETDYNAAEAAYQQARDAYWAAWEAGNYNVEYPDRSDYVNLSTADYMIASAPIEITVSDEASVSTTVTSTSIQLNLDAKSANTGYEIYRKVGKKYQKIATVAADVYTDKGLMSKTTYSYKVRPYYKDAKTGQTTYGKYTVVEATTKGSALNLIAKVNKKNKVQLTWQKVAGAKQYEIYRADTYSDTSVEKKGFGDGFSTYKKIATVKKNKKQYIDKKVSLNQSYRYIVRAIITKDKNVKGDKDTYIEAGDWVSLSFGSISANVTYTDAYGNETIEWTKVAGAKSYVIEKKVYNAQSKTYAWTPIQTLGKNATKAKLAAEVTYEADGSVKTLSTNYRIKAFNGSAYSDPSSFTTYKTAGVVQKVTSKAVSNGIQVSWTPVSGASYYRVYRVKTSDVVANKDQGISEISGGTQVTEYVGVTDPVAVDVAAWNAAVDQSIAQYKATPDANYEDYLHEYDKLSDKKTYHYQNYSYSRDTFGADTTSILDYFGDIYSGSGEVYVKDATEGTDGNAVITWGSKYYPVVADTSVKNSVADGRPQAGVSYTYYVEAVMATPKTPEEFKGDYGNHYESGYPCGVDYYTIMATTQAAYNTAAVGPKVKYDDYATPATVAKVSSYNFKNITGSTVGVKKLGTATYTQVQPVKTKLTIKSLSSSKGKVTLKLKKKVKAADYYKIYRSTKKKGKYTVAGITKNAKKTTFTDTGVEKGKTYYYKVVSVVKNEAGAEVEGKASKVKSIKVK